MIDKAKCREIHNEVNEAMRLIAQKHGLNYNPGEFRYNPIEIKGKIKFNGTPINTTPILVGSIVTVGTKSVLYKVSGFTTKGNVTMDRIRDNAPFRCKPSLLVVQTGLSGLVPAQNTQGN